MILRKVNLPLCWTWCVGNQSYSWLSRFGRLRSWSRLGCSPARFPWLLTWLSPFSISPRFLSIPFSFWWHFSSDQRSNPLINLGKTNQYLQTNNYIIKMAARKCNTTNLFPPMIQTEEFHSSKGGHSIKSVKKLTPSYNQ